jgi:post-segregation antitoxin (ccd killing protein)
MAINRVTVSVPRDLRRQMLAVGGEFNWSQIASRAIEQAIENRATRMHANTIICHPWSGVPRQTS